MMPKGVEHKAKACAADAAVLNAFRHHRVVSTSLTSQSLRPDERRSLKKQAATESVPAAASVILVDLFLRLVVFFYAHRRGRRLGSFCFGARGRRLG